LPYTRKSGKNLHGGLITDEKRKTEKKRGRGKKKEAFLEKIQRKFLNGAK